MGDYLPTYGIGTTAESVKDFVKRNNSYLWKIFKPLIPFIICLDLIDAAINDLFYTDSEESFTLGSQLSTIFISIFAISWHRLVIKGSNDFHPVTLSNLQRPEIIFILLAFAIQLPDYIIDIIFAGSIHAIIHITIILIFWYILYRILFFFPAIAVGHNISFKRSFKLTKGTCIRFIFSYIWASLPLILLSIIYGMTIVSLPIFWMPELIAIENIIISILLLPIWIYVMPRLTAIGVTVLSNYYLYALEQENKPIENETTDII